MSSLLWLQGILEALTQQPPPVHSLDAMLLWIRA